MKRITSLLLALLMVAIPVYSLSIFLADTLEEGEGNIYETSLGSYIVELVSVSDLEEKALFKVNNQISKPIKRGDSFQFKDKSEIVVSDLILNAAAEGNDEASFYFYGSGLRPIKIKNISRSTVEDNICNFDGRCKDEAKTSCCFDCGCPDNQECINNKCASGTAAEPAEEPAAPAIIDQKPSDEEVTNSKTKTVTIALLLFVALAAVPFFLIIYRHKKRF